MRRIAAALGAACVLAALGSAPAFAQEHARAAAPGDATVSVLHAVPGLTVDVYANGDEIIPNFKPGTLSDPLSLPAGSYDIAVFAAGDNPDTTDPAIEAKGVQVPAGANATVVANLDADGNPALNLFANDVEQVAPGEARLTVRHTAAAPAVDVRADGNAIASDLTNPNEAVVEVPAGTYSADVVLAGTSDVVIGPADLDLAEGTNTIVYAWGSATDDNLDLAVQTIDGLHSMPSNVPGGTAGLAPEPQPSSVPAWALGVGAASLLTLTFSGRRLVLSQRRR